MHKVVVVDDHTLLSQAILDLVNSFANFEAIYTCKHGQELIDRLSQSKDLPDVILMDVSMPILNGIQTTAILRKAHPHLKVLALSVESNEDTILAMIRAGAKGYVMKDVEKETLEFALNEVVTQGYYYSNEVSHVLASTVNSEKSTQQLSEREIEFVKLACKEMTYKEIAAEMFLSHKTIQGYRDSIYKKLGIKNRIGLMIYAVKHNLVRL